MLCIHIRFISKQQADNCGITMTACCQQGCPPLLQNITSEKTILVSMSSQNSTSVARYCVLSPQCWGKRELAKLAHYIMLELDMKKSHATQNYTQCRYILANTCMHTRPYLLPPCEQCHAVITFEFHTYMCACTLFCAFTSASQHKSGLTTFE